MPTLRIVGLEDEFAIEINFIIDNRKHTKED